MQCTYVWIWLCFLILNQFYVVTSAISLIASYNFFGNRPSCCIRAIPCQFSGSGQDTLSNFPEILLKFSYPIWWTSATFERNLSRNGMITKLFSWGGMPGGAQIVHIWPFLKPYYCQTTLVNNPNFSGMLVTLPNIEKITLSTLWLSKVKGHEPPKLTVSRSWYTFSKIFKLRHSFISW